MPVERTGTLTGPLWAPLQHEPWPSAEDWGDYKDLFFQVLQMRINPDPNLLVLGCEDWGGKMKGRLYMYEDVNSPWAMTARSRWKKPCTLAVINPLRNWEDSNTPEGYLVDGDPEKSVFIPGTKEFVRDTAKLFEPKNANKCWNCCMSENTHKVRPKICCSLKGSEQKIDK